MQRTRRNGTPRRQTGRSVQVTDRLVEEQEEGEDSEYQEELRGEPWFWNDLDGAVRCQICDVAAEDGGGPACGCMFD